MLRIGLTGGTGSGKSTVAGRLRELGATVVDADVLAREVLAPGSDGLRAVTDEFGTGVLADDGSLDRARLATLVFADAGRRSALEAITHPRIAARTAELVAGAPADGVLVHDVPLLVEKRMGAGYHLVVVVDADVEERVRRLVQGRGMDADDARARVRSQASDAERRAAADVWLENRSTPQDLVASVDRLWHGRLLPFAENLRLRRIAPRPQQAVVVDHRPGWAAEGERLVARVRLAARDDAVRVDHVGSTSVAGLAAKDCVDLQVVCPDLGAAERVADALLSAGLVRRGGPWWDHDRAGDRHDKALAGNADPGRTVNCHVRTVGSPAWRDALLLRDWLRRTPAAVTEYAALKRRLSAEPHATIDEYADSKTPWIAGALARADDWARATGWSPG